MGLIVGIDEAGVGTLAGPLVVVAAGFGDHQVLQETIRDSKTLSGDQRENLIDIIYEVAEWVLIKTAPSGYINSSDGIWRVWDEMMKQVLTFVYTKEPDRVIVDGSRIVAGFPRVEFMVKADKKIQQVGAASIVAKYVQTSVMDDLHERFPIYSFHKHHGYGTKVHLEALDQHGPTYEHRAHYKPVAKAIEALPAERRQKLMVSGLGRNTPTTTLIIGGDSNG